MKDKTTKQSVIPKKFDAYGFIRKDEEGGYTAICVNLSLFAQGDTVDISFNKLINSITSYLNDVVKNHPDDWDKYTKRPVPKSILNEFRDLLTAMRNVQLESCNFGKKKTNSPLTKMRTLKVREGSKQPVPLPNLSFVQQVSTTYAQASM